MTNSLKAAVLTAFILSGTATYAYNLPPIHFFVQGGGYISNNSGKAQHIGIQGLIGDNFSVDNQNDINHLFGTGFLVEGFKRYNYGIDYGINAFYLAKTKISGNIAQEDVFTNLSYKYYVSHLPVYVFAKGFMNTCFHGLTVTADAGIGPNFMSTNLYADSPLNNFTLPDNAFAGNFSTTVLSGMLGIGLKKVLIGQASVEIGYRYFFLGEGYLKPVSNQITSNLKTGNITAQALLLTVST